jgi:hypothetical protein
LADQYLTIKSGIPTMTSATEVSSGVAQANKIVALNSYGLLDASLFNFSIPQYTSDPVNPEPETMWMLATPSVTPTTNGTPVGLLLLLTKGSGIVPSSGGTPVGMGLLITKDSNPAPVTTNGTPVGLGLLITKTSEPVSYTYQLSYKTIQGPIVRVTMNP